MPPMPGLGTIARVSAKAVRNAKTICCARYCLFSPHVSAAAFAKAARAHRPSGNRLHRVRDVTCGEDAPETDKTMGLTTVQSSENLSSTSPEPRSPKAPSDNCASARDGPMPSQDQSSARRENPEMPPAPPCHIPPRPLNSPPTERWPSGRRRTPGKCVGGEPSRGFESLSLRHRNSGLTFSGG